MESRPISISQLSFISPRSLPLFLNLDSSLLFIVVLEIPRTMSSLTSYHLDCCKSVDMFKLLHLNPVDQSMGSASAATLSYRPSCIAKLQLSTSTRPLKIKARNGGRQDTVSIFVGSFVQGRDAINTHDLKRSLFSSTKRKAQVSSQMLSKALVEEEKEIEDEEHETEEKHVETENGDEETGLDEETLEKRKMVADMIADINSALDTVVERIHSDSNYDPEEVYLDLDKEEYGSFVTPVEYQSII